MSLSKINSNILKNLFLFSLLLSFIFSAEEHNLKYLSFDFYTKCTEQSESIIKNYFKTNYYSYMFTKFNIGSNSQPIEFILKLENYFPYIVNESKVNSLYVPYKSKESTSFVTLKEKNSFYGEDFYTGDICSETFDINSSKINDFQFIYTNEMTLYSSIPSGALGFKIGYGFGGNDVLELNFINQLKKKNIISDYGLTLIFDKKNKQKGKIFIGPDIELIDKQYEKFNKTVINSGTSGGGGSSSSYFVDWGFYFVKIEVGGECLEFSESAKLSFSNEFILGTDEYSDIIEKKFFRSLIDNKKCFYEDFEIKEHIYAIKCEKNINITNFPELKFTLFDNNKDFFKFLFNGNDLFEEKDEYKYFKVLLSRQSNGYPTTTEWSFGRTFFENFMVNLNRDKKTITFYWEEKKEENEINEINKNMKKKVKNYKIIISGLVIILVIFIPVFIFVIRKCLFQEKKIQNKNRKNILVNEMMYFPQVDQ